MKAAILCLLPLIAMAMLPSSAPAGEHGNCQHGLLSLKGEERTKLEKRKLEHHKAVVDLKAEREKIKIEMKMECISREPDRGKLNDYAEKMGEITGDITRKKLEYLLDVKGLLNSEQWSKFLRYHSAWGGHGCGEYHSGECRYHREHDDKYRKEHHEHKYDRGGRGEGKHEGHECIHNMK